MRVTPPPLERSIQDGFKQYAVRKGPVRSKQKSCYIIRDLKIYIQSVCNLEEITRQT